MTEKEHNDKGEPILLDGSPLCPRQKLQGIIPAPYNKFFTNFNDFAFYETYNHARYTWETLNEFMARDDEWNLLAELLDHDYIRDYYEKQLLEKREQKRLQKVNERASVNRYELGAREFTFTYSPKWFDDSSARLEMSSAIQKLCKYYKDEILQLRAIGEVGSAGLSHIHCFYKLKGGKKITDKNFTRAYKMWNTKKKTGPSGHQGGHHQTVKSESDFTGYIDKDIENAWFEVNIDNIENNPVAVNS